jgi:hypothetical protein
MALFPYPDMLLLVYKHLSVYWLSLLFGYMKSQAAPEILS